eukprot:gb/GEZN01006374.1/.p1 GENE.gb/GEZN01006374.1/~~gb/GEZN01006374.1/.p1  ORF type:complete len:281 (+),score=21.96 gb/GEZN01006374.1/:112-954(+)
MIPKRSRLVRTQVEFQLPMQPLKSSRETDTSSKGSPVLRDIPPPRKLSRQRSTSFSFEHNTFALEVDAALHNARKSDRARIERSTSCTQAILEQYDSSRTRDSSTDVQTRAKPQPKILRRVSSNKDIADASYSPCISPSSTSTMPFEFTPPSAIPPTITESNLALQLQSDFVERRKRNSVCSNLLADFCDGRIDGRTALCRTPCSHLFCDVHQAFFVKEAQNVGLLSESGELANDGLMITDLDRHMHVARGLQVSPLYNMRSFGEDCLFEIEDIQSSESR